jgi:hypothetical protein
MAAKTPLSSSALQSLHREYPTLDVNEILRPLSSVLTGFATTATQYESYTYHFVIF